MRYLKAVASGHVPGVGYAHAGSIASVPDDLAEKLIADGYFEAEGKERVTEVPAPTPAKAPRSRKG